MWKGYGEGGNGECSREGKEKRLESGDREVEEPK